MLNLQIPTKKAPEKIRSFWLHLATALKLTFFSILKIGGLS